MRWVLSLPRGARRFHDFAGYIAHDLIALYAPGLRGDTTMIGVSDPVITRARARVWHIAQKHAPQPYDQERALYCTQPNIWRLQAPYTRPPTIWYYATKKHSETPQGAIRGVYGRIIARNSTGAHKNSAFCREIMI